MLFKQQKQLTAKAKEGKLDNKDLEILQQLENTFSNLQQLVKEIREENDWKNCDFLDN